MRMQLTQTPPEVVGSGRSASSVVAVYMSGPVETIVCIQTEPQTRNLLPGGWRYMQIRCVPDGLGWNASHCAGGETEIPRRSLQRYTVVMQNPGMRGNGKKS